jgi:hypothetical protein
VKFSHTPQPGIKISKNKKRKILSLKRMVNMAPEAIKEKIKQKGKIIYKASFPDSPVLILTTSSTL